MRKDSVKYPFKLYTETNDGIIIPSRFHDDSMELVEVISGKVSVQIGTVFVEAGAGDFVFVPPTMVFRVDSKDGTASVRGIRFDSSILESNMEKFEVDILYMFYVQAKNRISVFDSSHPTHARLSALMQDAHDEVELKDVCYKLPIRANIYLMMTELLRYYCGSKDELDRMIYHNVLRLRPVVEYINEHFKEKMTIELLSGMINVSQDYFTKIFKDSMGKTPIDYINTIRVNRAMRYLSETDKSMIEIAELVGFCNSNYFHKIFKQYINSSPLVYRKAKGN